MHNYIDIKIHRSLLPYEYKAQPYIPVNILMFVVSVYFKIYWT